MSIKCGSCGDYHPNVQAVRGCHLARGVIKTAVMDREPVMDMGSPVDTDDYNEFDALAAAFPRDEARRVEPFKPTYGEPRGENFLINSKPGSPVLDANDRRYLTIPFAEKDEAKNLLKCRWDPTKKAWWVPKGTDLSEARPHWMGREPGPHSGAKPAAVELEDGIYKFDGLYYMAYHTVHGANQQVAKVLVLTEGDESGSWKYVGKAPLRKLTPAMKLGLEDAKEFGQVYGFCIRCGRTLTDEGSKAAGIGPICAEKW